MLDRILQWSTEYNHLTQSTVTPAIELWTVAFVQTHMDEYKWLVLKENTMLTTATFVTNCQVTEETNWPNSICHQTSTTDILIKLTGMENDKVLNMWAVIVSQKIITILVM